MAFFVLCNYYNRYNMKSGLHFISFWSGVIMILLVISMAVAVSFTDMFSDRLYGNKKIFFVILLLAYAVYRGFRLYQIFKQRPDEKN